MAAALGGLIISAFGGSAALGGGSLAASAVGAGAIGAGVTAAGFAGAKFLKGSSASPSGGGTIESQSAIDAKVAAEKQAEGAKSSKQAAAFLKDRNAQGFGSNPNKAKPFLLSL